MENISLFMAEKVLKEKGFVYINITVFPFGCDLMAKHSHLCQDTKVHFDMNSFESWDVGRNHSQINRVNVDFMDQPNTQLKMNGDILHSHLRVTQSYISLYYLLLAFTL